MSPDDFLLRSTGTIPELIQVRAAAHPQRLALQCEGVKLTYQELDRLMDRVAAALQRAGLVPGDVIAICASRLSLEFVATYFGAVRVGVVPTPLPVTAPLTDLVGMIDDSGAKRLITDPAAAEVLKDTAISLPAWSLQDDQGSASFSRWIASEGARPDPVHLEPTSLFNIIYSSGSTGSPKGIMHSHQLRWLNAKFGAHFRFDAESVTINATPPYANVTIGHLLYCLYGGGASVLMPKFDARAFLELAEEVKATHTFLVGLQYKRILEHPEFDRFDLSSFKVAAFGGSVASPEFKTWLLERWPGEVIEMYGMTEGGGRTLLFARERPDKLHTIGRPVEGFDIRIVGEDDAECAIGEVGEMVGRSDIMMSGYLNQPDKTREVQWRDPDGRLYIRMGDLAAFDEDGFLTLKDRKKDMIISGGANVYPSDIERVLQLHAQIRTAAVVGAPSEKWGETPVAFVELNPGAQVSVEELTRWANARLGKIQRIAALEIVPELPRTGPDKIAKPALRRRAAEIVQALA